MSVSDVIAWKGEMPPNGVIQRKLAFLDVYLLRLEQELEGVSFEQFRGNWAMQRMAERSLQVMVEIVIDICERLLALNKAGPGASSVEVVEKLVSLGVLRSLSPYAEMVRFRNLIVHQYAEINPELLYDLATKRLGDFRTFRGEIDTLDLK